MATFRRFIKAMQPRGGFLPMTKGVLPACTRIKTAIKDYFTKGEAGDLAYLKIELLHIGGNADLLDRLQNFAGYYSPVNLEQLSQLAEGTLGYEYARHMKKHNIHPLEISPDLIEAAKANPFALRYIATHDISHILLGFDTSYAGEIGVLGFAIGQNYSKFLNAYEPIVKRLYPLIFRSQAKQIRTNLNRGKAIGEQAECLLIYPFEDNWSRPIKEIRTELGLVLNNEQLNTRNAVDNKLPETATA